MSTPPNAATGSPPSPPAPWWSGPLFHLVTGTIVLVAALAGPHLGIDPTEANGAFIAGVGFLGVGIGVSSARGSS